MAKYSTVDTNKQLNNSNSDPPKHIFNLINKILIPSDKITKQRNLCFQDLARIENLSYLKHIYNNSQPLLETLCKKFYLLKQTRNNIKGVFGQILRFQKASLNMLGSNNLCYSKRNNAIIR